MREGLSSFALSEVRAMVGQGARALIARAAAARGVILGPGNLDALTAAFVERYRAGIARESRVFPGVAIALRELSDHGAALAVCTNKRTELSARLLEAMGLAQFFSVIVGADAVGACKPHPDHYRTAVQRAGGALRCSLMVGDSAADVAAARAAGAPVIAVRFGYSDVDAEKLGADAVIDTFADLAPVSRRLLAARP